jgi:3-hydroxyisobutyrate dehydrogenase-like beta-hydroxyacid dehydrogenase
VPGQDLRIGFVGVGHMGRPMVDRLVAAGWPTEVYVRRPEQRAELESAGVGVAGSPHELAARSDVVILCFFSDAQVREVMLADGVLQSMPPGSVLVSHVTGSPALAVDLQAAAPEGVTVLDVPISGTDDHIRRGELTLMVGGDPAALDRIRPALASYCNPILHVGGLGDGQRIKLINNLLFTVQLKIALQGAALAGSMGIPADEFARIVSECSGDSFAIRLFQRVPPEALASGARHYLVKDVSVIREVAAAQGIELGELGELANWVFE